MCVGAEKAFLRSDPSNADARSIVFKRLRAEPCKSSRDRCMHVDLHVAFLDAVIVFESQINAGLTSKSSSLLKLWCLLYLINSFAQLERAARL